MRTPPAGMLDALAAKDRIDLLRVRIASSAGSMIDHSDRVLSVNLSGDINSLAVSGTINLQRERDGASVAPLMQSLVSVASGRRVTVEVAVLAVGATVSPGDWMTIFDGTVDDVGWGGNDSVLTVPVRDKAWRLRDTFIEDLKNYGNDDSPVAVATVMQEVLDDALGVGAETLDVTGDPDFGIYEYQQQLMSVAQALEALNLIGWDLRYRWDDGSSAFVLSYYEPDRAKTTPDHTFSPDDYYDLTDVGRGRMNVRNRIEVRYDDDLRVVAEDTASIAEYGVRYMYLDYAASRHITTEAEAERLANAILADTAQPALTHVGEMAFWPLVEMGDLYRYAPNFVHYRTAQDVAVVRWEHRFTVDAPPATVLHCRGKPASGTTRWFRRGRRTLIAQEAEEPIPPVLVPGDIKLLLTTSAGDAGYTEEQPDANESLGGYISTTEAPDGLNELFRKVTDAERTAGITLYRSIAAVNFNDAPVPLEWRCVYAWLSDVGGDGVEWAIGVDPEGIVVHDREDVQSAICADEETAPADVVFVQPDSIEHADALNPGTVEAGEGFVIHIRQVVTADTNPRTTDSMLVFSDTIPEEEE